MSASPHATECRSTFDRSPGDLINFTELKDELFARGTNYLEESGTETARGERWLNQAYREICNLHSWPFLEAEATGTDGTVSIPDLRRIIAVFDSSGGDNPGRKLKYTTRRALVIEEHTEDLSRTGTPEWFYIENSVVKTYPVGSDVRVWYRRRIAPLTGTDVPIFDEEYHDLIVDGAMVRAYKDSDNFEAAAALRVEWERGVAAMTEDYQIESEEPKFISLPYLPHDG